ncbi:hypothetical protein [Nitrosopumilus sp.]|uniref:hypothetical protein n=1 Tax=Nitrosopumilus sp. TaxID=2024843 RepID=UPI00292E6B66|nr:hypothetical protein [Nitrosopumilus sp.]
MINILHKIKNIDKFILATFTALFLVIGMILFFATDGIHEFDIDIPIAPKDDVISLENYSSVP